MWLPLLLVGGAVVAYLSWRRRGSRVAAARPAERGAGVKGPLGSAGAMLRHKLSGERYAPSLYRVGMTVTVASGTVHPGWRGDQGSCAGLRAGAAGGERVSIAELGRVEGGGVDYVRLYLPERRGFFQIHAGPDGQPDECRFFAPIDEVSPASEAEWGAWLDPAEGMIGWPEFQTRDGKLYGRAWAPGEARVAPRPLVETIEGVAGTRTVRSQAMLDAAPTGAAEPAPPMEYILVSAVEAEGQAWVEIAAGIDVQPGDAFARLTGAARRQLRRADFHAAVGESTDERLPARKEEEMEDGVVVILTRGLPVPALAEFAVTLALLGVGVLSARMRSRPSTSGGWCGPGTRRGIVAGRQLRGAGRSRSRRPWRPAS